MADAQIRSFAHQSVQTAEYLRISSKKYSYLKLHCKEGDFGQNLKLSYISRVLNLNNLCAGAVRRFGHNILVGAPNILIGAPNILVGTPNILVGAPNIIGYWASGGRSKIPDESESCFNICSFLVFLTIWIWLQKGSQQSKE